MNESPTIAGALGGLLRQVQSATEAEGLGARTDGQLLEQFLAGKDEEVFMAVLRRHGPLVYRVCRRVLAQQADVEDAFQATFLVLIRQGRSIQNRECLASWLH